MKSLICSVIEKCNSLLLLNFLPASHIILENKRHKAVYFCDMKINTSQQTQIVKKKREEATQGVYVMRLKAVVVEFGTD